MFSLVLVMPMSLSLVNKKKKGMKNYVYHLFLHCLLILYSTQEYMSHDDCFVEFRYRQDLANHLPHYALDCMVKDKC